MPHCNEQPVQTPVGSSSLSGDLDIVDGIQGAVLMHMEEAQADSLKNTYVAKVLQGRQSWSFFSFFLFCFSLLKLRSKFAITTALLFQKSAKFVLTTTR
jgi:hypothetical protein